ncbi:MAG: phage portal protein [Colwellia sp.]|nr:phage portal protein [Colwellia sp.]
MFGINNLLDRWSYNRFLNRQGAFTKNNYINPFSNVSYGENLPGWVELSTPGHFEAAARYNPIVKGAINLLATTSSNGKKYLVDSVSGNEILWDDKNEAVQKIKKLLILRPNPMQSGKEYEHQGIFYLKVFGNRFSYALMPLGFDSELDLMNVEALYNLPSQFIKVKTTGKIYNQTTIEGIISEYARTNVSPVDKYEPHTIMHYNEVNISSEEPTIMGISKLEVLKDTIKNTQSAFQAMNSILVSRGMQGIISIDSKDGQGTIVPLNPSDKKEVDEKFKNDYGLLNGQNPFLISPVPLNYIKTAMNSKDLGIYEEFSNNSMLISNEFGIPPELLKTYIQGATYENQVQSVRRLYQDTTIPQVEESDQYTNYRLNLEKYGLVLKTKWDHVPALAENEKEKATANHLSVRSALEEFNNNLITWNQYLTKTNQEPVEEAKGNKYKWELDKERGGTNNGNGSNLE